MEKKSAKDIAFDKERALYRKQIRELEEKNRRKDINILSLQEEIHRWENRCAERQEWIDRLLEYMDMTEEDMRNMVAAQKRSTEIMARMDGLLSISRLISGGGYL